MKSFSGLEVFCDHVIRKLGAPDEVTEDQLAEEFRTVYLKGLPLNLGTLKAVAASCGIKLNGLEKMPDNMRGYHEMFDDSRHIYFRKGDVLSGTENTILHEIREMMETLFAEVNPNYMPLRTRARHIAANKFASAVLLPEEDFRSKVYETGLDIIALSRMYSKSCSQVLLRMGEVLQGRLFFYAALYEVGPGDKDWKVNYRTVCYNDEDLEANFHDYDGFFPKKGISVIPGSLVDMAINKKKAHLVRRITVLEDETEEGLIAIARPLMDPKSCAIKVALVVLLAQDGHILGQQIERAKPVMVERFHQHL